MKKVKFEEIKSEKMSKDEVEKVKGGQRVAGCASCRTLGANHAHADLASAANG